MRGHCRLFLPPVKEFDISCYSDKSPAARGDPEHADVTLDILQAPQGVAARFQQECLVAALQGEANVKNGEMCQHICSFTFSSEFL